MLLAQKPIQYERKSQKVFAVPQPGPPTTLVQPTKADGRTCLVFFVLPYQLVWVYEDLPTPKASGQSPLAVLQPSKKTKRYGRAPENLLKLNWSRTVFEVKYA